MKDDLWIATRTARLVMLDYCKGGWTAEEQDWADEEIERIKGNFRSRFPGIRGQKLIREIKKYAEID